MTRQAPPRPVAWTWLTPEEAELEWDGLRRWVAGLRIRFPNVIRLPDCWWRHNDLVEVLAALRDFERAAYAPDASATGPVEWHRALREMEVRLEVWTKKLTCSVPGRGHDLPARDDGAPPGWQEYVEQDVQRRKQQRSTQGEGGGTERRKA